MLEGPAGEGRRLPADGWRRAVHHLVCHGGIQAGGAEGVWQVIFLLMNCSRSQPASHAECRCWVSTNVPALTKSDTAE